MATIDPTASERSFRRALLLLLSALLVVQIAGLRRPQITAPTQADLLAIDADTALSAAQRQSRIEAFLMHIPLTQIHGTVTVDTDGPLTVEADGTLPVEFETSQEVTLTR